MLGILTLEGKGVEKNSAAAAKLFEKASADNDHVAMYELSRPCLHSLTLNSDIDIKIVFSKADTPGQKQLWTYNKNKTRQKWRVFKKNQL